jgi:hypothetical protein
MSSGSGVRECVCVVRGRAWVDDWDGDLGWSARYRQEPCISADWCRSAADDRQTGAGCQVDACINKGGWILVETAGCRIEIRGGFDPTGADRFVAREE